VSVIAVAVKHMLAAGMPHDAIIAAVTEMEAAATPVRSKGADRTARWRERHKASQSVTCDVGDACNDSDAVLSPEPKAPTPPKTQPLSPKENPPKGGQKKASRLPADWQPSGSLIDYAALHGVTGAWLARETERFRNHWLGKSGKDATKADWDATWRNWILRAVEQGPPKGLTLVAPNGHDQPKHGDWVQGKFYAHCESKEFEAWREYEVRIKGKPPPTDRYGGWLFPAEFPPTMSAQATA
jgi:hypothetical protein